MFPVEEFRILELAGDALDRTLHVRGTASAGADQATAPEEQYDHAGILESAYQAGELLWLVLHSLEPQRDSDRIEIDLALQVGGRDDVLDLDLRMKRDPLAPLPDAVGDDPQGGFHLFPTLPAGADDLPRMEEEHRGLRVAQPVDETGEAGGLVLGPFEGAGDRR